MVKLKYYKAYRVSLGWQILIGLILGVIIGALGYQNKLIINSLQPLGTIFINMIKMIVLPIVVSCLVVGIANMGDIHKLGRIGGKTLIYFEIMTTIAIALGLIVGNLTKPGQFIDITALSKVDISQYVTTEKSTSTGLSTILMNVVPTNIFKSLVEGDMLPIIFFSVLFGLGTATLGEKGKPIIDFFTAVSEVMFKVTNWVMKLAPIGVFALIGVTIAQLGVAALKPLGFFILVTYLTMIFFVIVVMGLVAKLFKIDLIVLLKVIKDEMVLAFSTASSEAALPKIMEKMENFGVKKGIVSFVIPTGYTFNLDGSAIYQSIAALFLAQAYHIHLSIGQQITLLVVLMITSKGMAGVPGASFVVLLATIATIGVPASGLAFIAGVDRIIDMGRTTVNVVGNSLAAVIIAQSENEFDRDKNKRYLKELNIK
ncbi:glutamate aspartate cation symporter [Dellaglioa algida DSM 15638]|uniref:Glutamate aspartate cation symporter n=1 Tax=Dellaglioa algida DSM 15638 TaxID=1423719 RepID=A0A0R1HNX2_9LACO|nr:glutamate aspartate cation symporter [Dellaglioa algida DSM 15638]